MIKRIGALLQIGLVAIFIIGCSPKSNKTLSQDYLVGKWYYKASEDAGQVFLNDKEAIGSRRAYSTLAFEASGDVRWTVPGPNDAPVSYSGTWKWEGDDQLVLDLEIASKTIDVIELTENQLIINSLPK